MPHLAGAKRWTLQNQQFHHPGWYFRLLSQSEEKHWRFISVRMMFYPLLDFCLIYIKLKSPSCLPPNFSSLLGSSDRFPGDLNMISHLCPSACLYVLNDLSVLQYNSVLSFFWTDHFLDFCESALIFNSWDDYIHHPCTVRTPQNGCCFNGNKTAMKAIVVVYQQRWTEGDEEKIHMH